MTTGAPGPLHDCLSAFADRLTDRRPLGIAVSGGSDSLGLLVGLARLLPARQLFALTVDHGLRAGSADEARRVKAHCRRLGIRHETLAWEGPHPETGLQAAARAARYRLLARAAHRNGLAAVVTAHTLDDQRETLEMRRARSGAEATPGLAGIPPATLFEQEMWVVRPLLGITREQIRASLRADGVDWIDDPSNRDPRFERVRVRARLQETPPEAAAGDGLRIAVARQRLAAGAAAYVDAQCRLDAQETVRCCRSPDADPEIVAAAIEALIDACGGAARPLDRRGKATLQGFLAGWQAGRAEEAATLGRCLLRIDGGDLVLRRERRGIDRLSLAPGETGVWDGRFRVRNLDARAALIVEGGGALGISPVFHRKGVGDSAGRRASDGVAGGFLATRLAGRSARILPVHEFALARSVARLLRAPGFPDCPVRP